ncbi:MAG: DUF58 domain-containing protein [Bacteroidetes bacterium]|jgi:uncharacterized protein (DUF58 family)|nr:DUF58 domain-containing protein [Bacteroidota bacterium]MBT3747466.1 DUF58 domain-containing protein [Bacteroidota bacterium]MBT4400226.1 DUF58 domain-containing protein [Bacteroidota bacterium]MBT4409262.1 DUF58 domain-containing protein [Bacteroidota bacterium]MBT5425998.1 DUF58 domain-containing protein [Bacteroidota bacterium]
MKNLAEIEELDLFTQLELIARQVVDGFLTGLHRSPYHGFSVEFAEHRHYNQGESTKHIDWKLYGRTEKLFVKRFEEETNLKAHLVLDISSSMLFPYPSGKLHNKLFFSIYCIAALIRLLRSQRDAVGLHLFSENLSFQSEARLSNPHAQFLYAELTRLLETVSNSDKKDLLNKATRSGDVLHELADSLPRRSMVIIFTDMLDQGDPEELLSALQHFRYNQHEVLLFHVIDEDLEGQFDFPYKPHRFIDMETAEVIRVNPADVKENYLKLMNQHRNEIKLRCGQYGIDLAQAVIQKDFRDVLMPFLIKRKKLF